MIPSAQNNSLVMNTLGRIDSPVMDTPGNLDFLADLVQAKELISKNELHVLRQQGSHLHCVFIIGLLSTWSI
jgi:hypothetical protein